MYNYIVEEITFRPKYLFPYCPYIIDNECRRHLYRLEKNILKQYNYATVNYSLYSLLGKEVEITDDGGTWKIVRREDIKYMRVWTSYKYFFYYDSEFEGLILKIIFGDDKFKDLVKITWDEFIIERIIR